VHRSHDMCQVRPEGDVLRRPTEAGQLMAGVPIHDEALDREMYRKARYTAFLMVWRLIEERGGMSAMRTLVAAVASGRDPDEASAEIYGADLSALAESLDPTVLGEPQGDATQTRRPHTRPVAKAGE
nr:hypothetical protein [bacterium]